MTLSRRTPLTRSAPMPAGDPARALSRRRQPAPGDASSVPLRARGRAPRTTGRGGIGQPKAGPPGEFSPAVKLAVRKRAGHGDPHEALCEGCGVKLGIDGGQVHHRVNRGAGGCRDEIVNSCAGALLLCGTPLTGCHGAATDQELHLRDDAAGFWIRHGTTPEFDPRNVGVMLYALGKGNGGAPVFLAADGRGPDGSGYLYQRPQAVAA